MRIAALYDIHGNLPALEAVLAEVRRSGVQRLVIGGDVVPGPMPRETLQCLLSQPLPVQFLRGNGEVAVLAMMRGETPAVPPQFRQAIEWNATQLRAEQDLLAGWPATLRIELPHIGPVLFCHATPQNENDIFTRATPNDQLRPIFERVDATLVVCGHTHMQFDRTIGAVRVINAGSVGMPFGPPGAYWLLLDATVELRRTEYDFAAAAEQIRATAYPQAEDFAARNVLNPPAEDEMIKAFALAETGARR